MRNGKRRWMAIAAVLCLTVYAGTSALADLKAGDQAVLFKSVDENLNPVDMADMIDGRPLVLVDGSCT